MMKEVLETIKPDYNFLVDGTLGHGWHSSEILRRFPNVKILWLDVDENMIKKADKKIEEFGSRIQVLHSSYANIGKCLKEIWEEKVDWIFLDLWVNLEHFKDASRWFSIRWTADLDMRFDMSKWMKASEILNTRSVTYHSIEDRMVKLKFRELTDRWNFELVYKKAVLPHYKEVEKNKAARSAKMRVIERVYSV